MSKRSAITLVIIGIVCGGVVAGTVMLGSFSNAGTMQQHLTVAEAQQGTPGEDMMVGGSVAPGTVRWDSASNTLLFTLTGEGKEIKVSYPGVAPNDFKPGSQLLVEGTKSVSGLFLATSLQTTTSPLCKTCHG